MEVLASLNFILLNIALFSGSIFWIIKVRRYSIQGISKLFLEAFVLFISQIVFILILLGLVDRINILNVSILSYLSFLVSLVVFVRKYKKIVIEKNDEKKLNGIILFVIFAPLAFLTLARTFSAFLEIPLEYDSVAYHLPFVVEWLNTGSLKELYYSAFAGPLAYYPSNYELLDLWVMLPFRNDFLVNVLNIFLLPVLGIVIYKILRLLNAKPIVSAASTGLLLYMPVFLRQIGVPLVDLFFSLMFALAIYFLLEIWNAKIKGKIAFLEIFLFALSLGLFIGTKYLGLIMAPPLIIILLVILFKYAKKKIFIYCIALSSFGLFLTGSFFYIRNWIAAGNPLFPVDISFFGTKLFDGYSGMNERLVTTSLWANVNGLDTAMEFLGAFYSMIGPQGILMAIFGIILLIIFAKSILRTNRNFNHEAVRNGLLLLGMAVYFLLYIKSPYSYKDLLPNVRYSMPFLILGIIALGYVASKGIILRIIFYLASIYSIIYSLLNHKLPMDFSILIKYKILFIFFILATVLILIGSYQTIKKNKVRVGVYNIVAGIILFSLLLPNFYSEREKLSRFFYTSWFKSDINQMGLLNTAFWFNNNANNARIAYSGFNYHYHLFGRDLNRQVDYVNINECTYCRYIDFKNSSESIRTNPNYESWLSNLKLKQKNYLVVQPTYMPEIRSYEFEWAVSNPQIFKKVFEDNGAYIFRIEEQ